MGDLTESSTPQARQVHFREDCWTAEATSMLIDVWGRRYLELNRGNLRQKDWQEVADAVNAHHAPTKKTSHTDVQCKNRIDPLKKKYKVEKTKIAESDGTLTSSWPFFSRFQQMIGNDLINQNNKLTTSPTPSTFYQYTPPLSLPSPPMALPLQYSRPPSAEMFSPMILPRKRPAPSPAVDGFRRNYSAMAAAAAAEDALDGEEYEGGSEGEETEGSEDRCVEEGMRRLAKAIERFGEIHEKVEAMKQRQMVELEKQRMQFAKDLEAQRMQLFMDTQLYVVKMKRAK